MQAGDDARGQLADPALLHDPGQRGVLAAVAHGQVNAHLQVLLPRQLRDRLQLVQLRAQRLVRHDMLAGFEGLDDMPAAVGVIVGAGQDIEVHIGDDLVEALMGERDAQGRDAAAMGFRPALIHAGDDIHIVQALGSLVHGLHVPVTKSDERDFDAHTYPPACPIVVCRSGHRPRLKRQFPTAQRYPAAGRRR